MAIHVRHGFFEYFVFLVDEMYCFLPSSAGEIFMDFILDKIKPESNQEIQQFVLPSVLAMAKYIRKHYHSPKHPPHCPDGLEALCNAAQLAYENHLLPVLVENGIPQVLMEMIRDFLWYLEVHFTNGSIKNILFMRVLPPLVRR